MTTIIVMNPPACPTCGQFACVCKIKAEHDEGCKFRTAAAGSVAIQCEHGFDVCPQCDPCTCQKEVAP